MNKLSPLIGKTVTIHDKRGKHRRKVVEQYFQYGKRIYGLIDVDTKQEHTALADVYDQMFLTIPGKIKPERTKGPAILHRQAVR